MPCANFTKWAISHNGPETGTSLNPSSLNSTSSPTIAIQLTFDDEIVTDESAPVAVAAAPVTVTIANGVAGSAPSTDASKTGSDANDGGVESSTKGGDADEAKVMKNSGFVPHTGS